ncbi:MAG: TAT-variant-translocated molybdopterin oxidoreductase [Ignavibacteriales bacterium]|nr:TAT-variant-translocated molybdopterin oxidoreductase [Ignavibacteriales bacterium]
MSNESNYWKSLRELHDKDSVSDAKAHEFMAGVTDDFQLSELSAMSRKQFLALLTASASFAAAGCSNYRDRGEIVPYSKKPEEVTPGVPNYYASTCNGCAQSCGILVKTREGRPIKIDGNPDHPVNRGRTCATGQASILNLYDPNRLRGPVFGAASGKSGTITWKQADAEIAGHLENSAKAAREIAVVLHSVQSPTAAKVLAEFRAKYPTTRLYVYDSFNDANRRHAWELSYGTREIPSINWDKAKIVLSLESDFLGNEGMTLEQIRRFTDGRDVMKTTDFNRLYAVEGAMSLTGANADYRLRLRPDEQLSFVLALINEIAVVRRKGSVKGSVPPQAAGITLRQFASEHLLSAKVLEHLVDDLSEHAGRSFVIAGDILESDVHIAVNYLNELLGNNALYEGARSETLTPLSGQSDLESLVEGMKSGRVGMIVHFGTNPVFQLPTAFGYEEALKHVPVSVSLVEAEDETSRYCSYVLPVNHALESWGDFKVRSGVYSFQQPIVAPLYDTRQKEAVLLSWTQGKDSYKETLYHEYLMTQWEKTQFPGLGKKTDFKTFWYSALHDGVLLVEERGKEEYRFKWDALASVARSVSGAYAIGLTRNYYVGDGTFANNGWLQELPHPVSKVVWDNYAAISTMTAKALGVDANDTLEISLPYGKQTVPVFVQPGQADGYISIELGYGRTNAGPIGSGVGVDVGVLLPKSALVGARVIKGASVTKAAGKYDLASTQEHHSLDDSFVKDFHLKRGVIQEGTVLQYAKEPDFLHKEKKELFSIHSEVEYNGVKWAMAIDLNKCIGCNACVAGCNVENNIPVVGKEQVAKGREMQWIRLDRYYSGTSDAPVPSHQPMLCQHCDQAPCENVCPVVATTHSPDGLNQMVYNRCVGTKYCSNNCPYKVRRFNFFNWRDHVADGYYEQQPIGLLHNPEVTVRSRGVMEKCTFCVQRIMEVRQLAAEKGVPLKGSDVKTACQDACPATAIVFGDMSDPKSDVSVYRSHQLGYHVLEETNARPNVTYLAKLRNIHSENLT